MQSVSFSPTTTGGGGRHQSLSNVLIEPTERPQDVSKNIAATEHDSVVCCARIDKQLEAITPQIVPTPASFGRVHAALPTLTGGYARGCGWLRQGLALCSVFKPSVMFDPRRSPSSLTKPLLVAAECQLSVSIQHKPQETVGRKMEAGKFQGYIFLPQFSCQTFQGVGSDQRDESSRLQIMIPSMLTPECVNDSETTF